MPKNGLHLISGSKINSLELRTKNVPGSSCTVSVQGTAGPEQWKEWLLEQWGGDCGPSETVTAAVKISSGPGRESVCMCVCVCVCLSGMVCRGQQTQLEEAKTEEKQQLLNA